MLGILITQCLQRDFVQPLEPHERLPNALHVGREEATRLLGADPSSGPLAQLMHWARDDHDDRLHIVHVRDWHDAEDARQHAHLQRFGPHCLAATEGAELVLGLDAGVATNPNEQFVDSITLNDFEGGTNLAEVLSALTAGVPEDEIRVGVVGVWTEAKVTFLLYELLTRCGISQLATCSALTASASRSQHFIALEQMRKILGVEVFSSVGEFASWLLPDSRSLRPPAVPRTMRPRFRAPGGGVVDGMNETDLDVISYLYRDSSEVELDPLAGGFSGARVFRAKSWDAFGHEQASSVLKLGPRKLVADERVAFERVEAVLGNEAPSIRGFADFGEGAGLKYAYAAMGSDSVRTFKSLYEDGAPQARVDTILTNVFDDILGRFYAAAQYERLPLLDYYTFDSRYAEGVRDRVAFVTGGEGEEEHVVVGGREWTNVARFYAETLDVLPRHHGEFHFVSYVHGDLNGANILLDGRDNVWLIDFFHAHRGHVLRDMAKLENDLLFIMTELETELELEQALRITDALRQVQDLEAPLPEHVEGLTTARFRRVWQTLRTLRKIVGRVCREDRDPLQLSTALMRYAVHTLWFDESSPLQKKWALAAAGGHAADLSTAARINRRLRLDWLESDALASQPGRVALTLCPGRRDKSRDLDEDLLAAQTDGATHVISLLTNNELAWAGVSDLAAAMSRHGLRHMHEPIVDQGVPTFETMAELVRFATDAIAASEQAVVMHCMGGLGRAGTVAACTLVTLGDSPEEAIAAVRRARGPRALETTTQESYVSDFAAWWTQRG